LKIKFNLTRNNEGGGGRNELISSGTTLRKPKITENEKKANVPVTIRSISIQDIDQVYAIESESFFTPYNLSFFKEFPDSENCFLFVAEKPEKLIGGYIAFKIQKNKLQLVSIAVGSNSRRMGIAQQMITTMMRLSSEMKINRIYLHVSVMNFPAQNLYKSFGFLPNKWISNYYADESEDAIIMTNDNISDYFDTNTSPSSPSSVIPEQDKSNCVVF